MRILPFSVMPNISKPIQLYLPIESKTMMYHKFRIHRDLTYDPYFSYFYMEEKLSSEMTKIPLSDLNYASV